MSTQNLNNTPEEVEELDLKEILMFALRKWHWFVASVFMCVSIAVLYLSVASPQYSRSAEVLIKNNNNDLGLGANLSEMGMGMFRTGVNVYNELVALKSPSAIMEVVDRLDLNINYSRKEYIGTSPIYGRGCPVVVSFPGIHRDRHAKMRIEIQGTTQYELSKFEWTDVSEQYESEEVVVGNFGDVIATPLGDVCIMHNPEYGGVWDNEDQIVVSRSSIYNTSVYYSKKLNVSQTDDMSTVVVISMDDSSIQRAEDFINELIKYYSDSWVENKNELAVSTSQFIDDRMNVISQSLTDVDAKISDYKSETLMPDLQSAVTLYMQRSAEVSDQVLLLNNQLQMAEYIKEYIADDQKKGQLLPINSGVGSAGLETQIGQYNELIMQRNALLANSNDSNPIVVTLDSNIDAMRGAIIMSLDNQVVALQKQMDNLTKAEDENRELIASAPQQAKQIIEVERQQKVMESLYLFLLEKREENELSKTFTAYNTRILTPPYGSMEPVSPRRLMTLALAMFIGLLIPFGLIFLIIMFDTKVRSRRDIEKVTNLPVIGEIPSGMRPLSYLDRIRRKKRVESYNLVVKSNSRNLINEAFRVIRTNIEFITCDKVEKSDVVMVTSFNPGSGKTYTTMNIAASFAISRKKVLVIDCDIRKGTLSNYVNTPVKGLTNYLNGSISNINELIVKMSGDYASLSVLPVGVVPPNPSELLSNGRFGELLEKLRCEYDYIFIDTAPLFAVTDTLIVEKFVDRTLFVIRAKLFDKDMLASLDNIYTDAKVKNLVAVLNGTENKSNSGYGSYGYGYGYGYGNGYDK